MVYLLLEQVNPGAEERVVGYHAICPPVVVRDDMPKALHRGGAGREQCVPAPVARRATSKLVD